jgi:hypothetical protein
MSDQIFALLLTLGFLILMVVWVPFLDFLQNVVRQSREGSDRDCAENDRNPIVDGRISIAPPKP